VVFPEPNATGVLLGDCAAALPIVPCAPPPMECRCFRGAAAAGASGASGVEDPFVLGLLVDRNLALADAVAAM